MWDDLATILTFVGVLGLFDQIVDHAHRRKVAEFVFGFHNVSFSEFETNIINGLLSFFVKGSRINYLRVLVVSLPLTYFSIFGISVVLDATNNDKSLLHAVLDFPRLIWLFIEGIQPSERFSLLLVLLLPILAYPFDLYSLWITKRLFWKRERPSWAFFPFVLCDVLLSIVPVGVVLVGSDILTSPLIGLVTIGLFLQLPSTILLSIVQLLTVFSGTLFRIVVRLTKLNSYLVLLGRLHEIPFSFLGFLAGLIFVLIV